MAEIINANIGPAPNPTPVLNQPIDPLSPANSAMEKRKFPLKLFLLILILVVIALSLTAAALAMSGALNLPNITKTSVDSKQSSKFPINPASEYVKRSFISYTLAGDIIGQPTKNPPASDGKPTYTIPTNINDGSIPATYQTSSNVRFFFKSNDILTDATFEDLQKGQKINLILNFGLLKKQLLSERVEINLDEASKSASPSARKK
jgi:hypothetical protein